MTLQADNANKNIIDNTLSPEKFLKILKEGLPNLKNLASFSFTQI